MKSNANIPINISTTRKNSSSNPISNGNANISIGKENLSKNPADKSSELLFNKEETLSANNLHDSTGTRNELFSKTEKDENIKISNLNNEVVINEDENQNKGGGVINDANISYIRNNNNNLNVKEIKENTERKNLLASMLKSIVTIDIIMGLKILKNEIKEYFQKYGINVFGVSNDIDFSVISVQEQNSKFSEFLKLGLFNDIYENTLSKYFNEFYKPIFADKEFLGSLEKILVHYFKVNNQLQDNASKIIDFNDVIKTYTQKQ